MSLIGVNLLGNTFVQDPNQKWIKINNVAIGESHIYGYKTIINDIGAILNNVDSNTTCVIYNWSNNTGYLKTGFNLNDKADYQIANGYTSFILKSKITATNSIPVTNPIPSPVPKPKPMPVPSNFVTWDTNKFILNGNKFVPIGFNAYWMGLTENYDYPTNIQVDEIFNIAIKMSATTIRSHTVGGSSGSQNSLRPCSNDLNINAWKAIDYVFYKANQTGIKLICPLTDTYMWYNGNYGDYCNPKESFWRDPNARINFKNYIYKWLNHTNSYTGVAIKNDPALLFIELGNELGNIRPDSGSTTVPTKEWLADISSYIKTIDKSHLLMPGTDECLGSNTSNDFSINTLDVFSSHFYGEDYARIKYDSSNSKNIKKPYIIGEYSSQFQQDWFNAIENIPNVLGSFAWSIYCHDNGLPTGNRVLHNDGFTFWYDNQDSQNTRQLLLITNHIKRMRNLPIITSINL